MWSLSHKVHKCQESAKNDDIDDDELVVISQYITNKRYNHERAVSASIEH